MKLNRRSKYLQIAFNRSLDEVKRMVGLLPASDKILIEAGTSLVKRYGQYGIQQLTSAWSVKLGRPGYIIADLKCMDRGSTEVEAAAAAGASAATCLGLAPVETINEFIKRCQRIGIDAMVDMMNVEFPFSVLEKLHPEPEIVVLHRGVDERVSNRNKPLPHDQINRIKGTYQMFVSLAGGETIRDVERSFFNNADIVVVWEKFYDRPDLAAELAGQFLKMVK